MEHTHPPCAITNRPLRRWKPEAAASSSVFTAFVAHQRGARTPDPVLFHNAWNGLQAALGGELKRRGLWQSPPCYLGVYGYQRWGAEDTVGDPMSQAWGHTRAPQSALGELVTDCWAFIFSDRMNGLKLQLTAKENIEGLVLRNVKNFVHDRQREHDPVGFRVFERLSGAIAGAVSRRVLYVLGGDRRIRNHTVLGFDPSTQVHLPAFDFTPLVARWNDELLPALVTARGREEAALMERLERLILTLPRHGVPCFRFRDLVDPLKHDARLRWAACLERDAAAGPVVCPEQAVETMPQVMPECSIESWQSLAHLTRSVSVAIRRAEIDPRTRVDLRDLWDFLVRRHAGNAIASANGLADGDETREGPLSQRQLAQRLKIPRDRLPHLFANLRRLVSHCLLTAPPTGLAAVMEPTHPAT